MLFVARQRDAFHVDEEGVAHPSIIISVFLREVVVKPSLKFSKLALRSFFKSLVAAVSSCCTSWQALGNMSSLSLDK